MGAPTVYYYDDPGAPVISNGQDGFYQILRACLIDGYGSKPAAGWSVVHDDWAASGHASFTNAAGSGVLGLVRATTTDYPPFMYVAQAMIDAQTAVNARSGRIAIADITAFSEGSTQYTQRPWTYRAYAEYWCVIANENFALFFCSNSLSRLFSVDPYDGELRTNFSVGFGSARSLRGLGSVSSAEVGNFIIVGGVYSSVFSESNGSYRGYWDENNQTYIRAHTILVGADSNFFSGSSFVYLTPLLAKLNTNDAFGEGADSVVELQLQELILVVSSSTARYGVQLCGLPMIRGSNFLSSGGVGWDIVSRFGAVSLKDIVVVAGKPHLTAPVRGGLPVFISLDASDWS